MGPEMITFLSSIASGVLAIVICIINNHYQNSKTLALLDLRLNTLEEKVDKHNKLVERMYKLEQDTAVQEEKLRVANHRIDDLEKGAEK